MGLGICCPHPYHQQPIYQQHGNTHICDTQVSQTRTQFMKTDTYGARPMRLPLTFRQ
ncbi:hypothetical protein RV134_320216 [Roseovarius sp. EC-HK134]|nr:hypothetical protein RV134_320216 [Roseovarius sp. EC-HK134]